MHLLNAAVAVTSALAGTVAASAAYGTLNTTPIEHTDPRVEPALLTHYLPCEPPSTLIDGVCVTTVVRTVVKTAEPKVITIIERRPSSKGKGSTPHKTAARDDGDREDHGEDEDEHEDHEHEDHEHEDQEP
jgi:hypothetical protein